METFEFPEMEGIKIQVRSEKEIETAKMLARISNGVSLPHEEGYLKIGFFTKEVMYKIK